MRLRTIFLALALCVSCTRIPESGVSYDLALQRKADISMLEYRLSFDIPAARDQSVRGHETMVFDYSGKHDLVLDFKAPEENLISVQIGGKDVDYRFENEHIIIPRRLVRAGRDSVSIAFVAGEKALNRRPAFCYTLLVPDRARTLFPCFDQPDLKATFQLDLHVPEGWKAISNTKGHDGHFEPTEPLSTYLFAFVAGEFQSVGAKRGDDEIRLYHRETDPAKVAQCEEVLSLVNRSLDWLEEYTGVPYPFAKYDLIVLPDFQFGGMEHTGATLYNDSRIFLGAQPTTNEILDRASLIAHETAHMWFGDLVTMKWFDDVWTKEVFANYFASKVVAPMFPQVNQHISDMRSYYAASYSEDRTLGSNAIKRPLDNLRNAGLIYCNIIYDKAPIAMAMLEQRIGSDAFRAGIGEYLRRFAYSNADWDDLIAIFDPDGSAGIKEWSRVWIKEKGMPIYDLAADGRLTQTDPFGAGNVWEQPVLVEDVDGVPVPNFDGRAYGWFRLTASQATDLARVYGSLESENSRMSVVMSLYENALRGEIPAEQFVSFVRENLLLEPNSLIVNTMLDYACTIAVHASSRGSLKAVRMMEEQLLAVLSDRAIAHETRLLCFRSLQRVARSAEVNDLLLQIWRSNVPYEGLQIGETDFSSLALQVMIRFPELAAEVRAEQLGRFSSTDRRDTFDYVSRAVSASKAERDALFESMLTAEGRAYESRVRTALSWLCHPLRGAEALAYIRPALEVIEDVQLTGDIFFPQNWCHSLIDGQAGPEAEAEVCSFLAAHPALNPLLATKILQTLIQGN